MQHRNCTTNNRNVFAIGAALLALLVAGGQLQAADMVTLSQLETPGKAAWATQLNEELQPGTLVFHRGECLAVKLYTQSAFTHVGVVMPASKGKWVVYDSANGDGVRKSNLTDYLKECLPDEVAFYHPKTALSPQQTRQLSSSLNEHLGREYSISHYVSGDACDGLHCSEYATIALKQTGVLHAFRPARVSPASLLAGIEDEQLYEAGSSLVIAEDEIPPPPDSGWCGTFWHKTKAKTAKYAKKMNRMVTCCD